MVMQARAEISKGIPTVLPKNRWTVPHPQALERRLGAGGWGSRAGGRG
jgi:hypothetical protein